jgi:hypothetical protein
MDTPGKLTAHSLFCNGLDDIIGKEVHPPASAFSLIMLVDTSKTTMQLVAEVGLAITANSASLIFAPPPGLS